MISPMRYVSMRTPASSIAREDDRERELDLAVQALRAALGDLRDERRGEAASGLGVPDERGRLLLRRRVGLELDAVLGHEVVELVLGAARVDQVRERASCPRRQARRAAAASRRARTAT